MAEKPNNPGHTGKLSTATQWDMSEPKKSAKTYPQPRQWDRWENGSQQKRQGSDSRAFTPQDFQNDPYGQYDFRSGGQEPPKKSNTPLVVILVVLGAALLAAIAFAAVYFARSGCDPAEPSPTSKTEPPTSAPVIAETEPPEQPVAENPTETEPPTPPPTQEPTSPVRKDGKQVFSADALSPFDVVTFGRYPQSSLGDEAPIEWYVVQVDGNKAQLISRYCLDSLQFHGKNEEISFRNSSLFQWLNAEFKNRAFSAEERTMLAREILLPDKAEVFRLLPETYRRATGTDYAVANGYEDLKNIWWLGEFSRTTYTYDAWDVTEHNCAFAVIGDGSDVWDFQVDFRGKGVRPMIIIQF